MDEVVLASPVSAARNKAMLLAGNNPESLVEVELTDGNELGSGQTVDPVPTVRESDSVEQSDVYVKRKGLHERAMRQHKVVDEELVITMAGEEKSAKVSQFLIKVFDKVALFEGMGYSHYERLVREMGFVRVSNKKVVIRQGDVGDRFYIIEKGKYRVTVVGHDGKGNKKVCKSFKRGQCFGELALMYNTPRACSITAKQDGELWVLDRFAFRRILTNVTKVKLERNLNFLKKIPIFQSCKQEEMVKLATAFNERRFAADTCIVKQGGIGDSLFVILEGTCKVVMYDEDNDSEVELNRLNAGDYFGEQALVNQSCRNADVVSVGKVVALRLDRDIFELLLGKKETVQKHMHRRMNTYDKQAEQAGGAVKRLSLDSMRLSALSGEHDDHPPSQPLGRTTSANSGSRKHKHVRGASLQVVLKPDVSLREKQGLMGDRQTFKKQCNIDMADLTRLAVLGNGSFGTVYLVKHEGTGEQFALKQVTKRRVHEADVQENIDAEIEMMQELHHDFIIRLHKTFEDNDAYWLLEDLALGGELQRQLVSRKRFGNDASRFYVASVVLAFEHMHNLEIIYRDLKPENVLLNNQGYARLTDLGFAKRIPDGRTYTYCGTPCYLAPEMIKGEPYGKGVDWWTLGVFTYELVCGASPFRKIKPTYDDPGCSLNFAIVNQPLKWPDSLEIADSAKDFMRCLLQKEPNRRLGVIHGGVDRIKMHAWFTGFDWKALEEHTLKPPIIPYVDDNTIKSARRNFGVQQGRSSLLDKAFEMS